MNWQKVGCSGLLIAALSAGAGLEHVDPMIGSEGAGSEYGGMRPIPNFACRWSKRRDPAGL